MLLSTNEKFLNEYSNFKARIEKIQNEQQKSDLTGLLNEMVSTVKDIDKKHELLAMRSKMPATGDDPRTKLFDLRKKIDLRLREYENLRRD